MARNFLSADKLDTEFFSCYTVKLQIQSFALYYLKGHFSVLFQPEEGHWSGIRRISFRNQNCNDGEGYMAGVCQLGSGKFLAEIDRFQYIGGQIIVGNFLFQNGLGLTIKTA